MDLARNEVAANRNKNLLGCVLLVAFLGYANALADGFVYDDHSQIEQNPYIHSFRAIAKIFTMRQPTGNYYRPLMNVGFLLSFKLFGASPYGFHLVNILLHCVVVWLVYEVGRRLTGNGTAGLIAAACFAIHPIHTESVTWIAAVADIEMTIFYLAAFWFFLQLGKEKGRTLWLQIGMLVSFFLAVLSKEPAMTLPALATVYEHLYRADREMTTWKQKVSRYGGLWLAGAAYVGVRLVVLGGFAPVAFHRDVSWREAAFIAVGWIGQYGAKLVWPSPLTVFYAIPRNASLLDWHASLGIAVLVTATGFVLRDRKRDDIRGYLLLWILFTVAPVLNVRWLPMDAFAERYLYLPSVGFSWLTAGIVLSSWKKVEAGALRRWAFVVAAGILALVATNEIFARNRDWKDDYSLALKTVQTNPDDSNRRADVAMAEWRAGNRAEAMRQWQIALAYRPDSLQALSDLGFAMIEEKKYDEAMPYLLKANELSSRFATPHVHLAHAYAALGKTTEAEAEIRRALEIAPTNTFVRNAAGQFYLDSGRPQEAEAQFRASVNIAANYDGWFGLAGAYTLENFPDKASEAWHEVLVLEPFDARAHLNLGRLYLAKGSSADAAREFDQTLLMDPNNSEARNALQMLRPQARPAE
jgi:protein O-mannosyl-transferase